MIKELKYDQPSPLHQPGTENTVIGLFPPLKLVSKYKSNYLPGRDRPRQVILRLPPHAGGYYDCHCDFTLRPGLFLVLKF